MRWGCYSHTCAIIQLQKESGWLEICQARLTRGIQGKFPMSISMGWFPFPLGRGVSNAHMTPMPECCVQHILSEFPRHIRRQPMINPDWNFSAYKLYNSHPVYPRKHGGQPEYHMNQLRGWLLTNNLESYRLETTTDRKSRDWANEKRDEFIKTANRRATHLYTDFDFSLSALGFIILSAGITVRKTPTTR
jgi:hypothetical protein